MVAYALLLLCASYIIRHDHPHRFALYFLAVLPAVPIIGVLGRLGRYLQQETDEYQRLHAMQATLLGAAGLLGTLVVNDFLRAFAGTGALPPFIGFMIFFTGVGLTQIVQRLRDRVPADD